MKPLKTTLYILFALSLILLTAADCDNPVDPDPPDPYDGPWEKVTVPDDLGNKALDFLGPNDGWVCGYGNVGHWDGNSWSVVKRYGDSENKYFLSGIQAIAPNDIWFSGTIESGSPPYTYTGVIIHYDGNNWNEEQLAIITGVNSIHIFDDGTGWGGGVNGVIYYDGSDWILKGTNDYRHLFFLSKTDGWACGLSKIYHWDGTEWTEVLADYDVWFEDIYFTAPDDGWAVSSGSAYGAAGHYHWDGTSWTEFDDDTIDQQGLWAVHFLRSDWGWAVRGSSYFFNGETWERIKMGNEMSTGGNDIYCLSENDVWVAGTGPYFYHFSGF